MALRGKKNISAVGLREKPHNLTVPITGLSLPYPHVHIIVLAVYISKRA